MLFSGATLAENSELIVDLFVSVLTLHSQKHSAMAFEIPSVAEGLLRYPLRRSRAIQLSYVRAKYFQNGGFSLSNCDAVEAGSPYRDGYPFSLVTGESLGK